MGGISSEREISLRSGAAVAQGLRDAGHHVEEVRLDSAALPDLSGFDAAFLALHGRFGEDGTVQALLDRLRLPYTGPGAEASRKSFDKIATRDVLIAAGLPVAKGVVLHPGEPAESIGLPLPFVVKPPREGSSVGVSIVKRPEEIIPAVTAARDKAPEGDILIEDYIPGAEWTVGIVGEEALPPIEISANLDGGWYSWDSKYKPGGCLHTFPEDNPRLRPLIPVCQELALKAYHALGCRGLGRVDFRITPEGTPFILEMNTLPGFTSASLLPDEAARAGYTFSGICEKILELAAFDEA